MTDQQPAALKQTVYITLCYFVRRNVSWKCVQSHRWCHISGEETQPAQTSTKRAVPHFCKLWHCLVSFPFNSFRIYLKTAQLGFDREAAARRICCLSQTKQGRFVLAEPLWACSAQNSWLIFGNVPVCYGCWSGTMSFSKWNALKSPPRQYHADPVRHNSNNPPTNLVSNNHSKYMYIYYFICIIFTLTVTWKRHSWQMLYFMFLFYITGK